MEFSPMTCWHCPHPVGATLVLLSLGAALFLGAFALAQARARMVAWLGWVLFVLSALFCLAVTAVIMREGVDWRWERTDFNFVRNRILELGALAVWWGLLIFAAVRLRRRRKLVLR